MLCYDDFDVMFTIFLQVYVHTPKSLGSSPGKRTAILYAHGGGAISGTADMYQPLTAALAVETGGPQYLCSSAFYLSLVLFWCSAVLAACVVLDTCHQYFSSA